MAEKAKINCPVCKGVGQIVAPKPSEDIGKKVRAAKELKKAGFSFREIMKFMNYKSTRSVSYLFEK